MGSVRKVFFLPPKDWQLSHSGGSNSEIPDFASLASSNENQIQTNIQIHLPTDVYLYTQEALLAIFAVTVVIQRIYGNISLPVYVIRLWNFTA